MAMFAMINPKTGRRNPNNVKALRNFFPASSWMITQSRVPHANPKLPKVLVNGIDSRRSGIIQQIEINIFVVLLWLYISLLGKYTDMHLRFKHKTEVVWWNQIIILFMLGLQFYILPDYCNVQYVQQSYSKIGVHSKRKELAEKASHYPIPIDKID